MVQEINSSTEKYLRGKYSIVGVGETGYTRGSGVTTRVLGTRAVRAAVEDSGLAMSDVDGMLSYSFNDSTPSPTILRVKFKRLDDPRFQRHILV